jgi:molecular chaperone Hsp33
MIQAPIDDAELEASLSALPPDGITIFTLGGGKVRGALLNGTRMVNAMRANHGLGPLGTMALGQAYLCAGLLGSTVKGGDRIGIRADGDGPAEGFSVEASADGSVRGWLFRPEIAVQGPIEDFGSFSIFGSGSLTVARFAEGRPAPFTGTVALKTGRLAQDMSAYYLESEQTRTAFALGIDFDADGRARGAGALFFQALPGADEGFLAKADAALAGLPLLGRYFSAGGGRETFLYKSLHPLFPEILGEKRVAFRCPCSRERFAAFLRSSNGELLAELAGVGPWPVETLCHNCGSAYHFPREELEGMLEDSLRG